MESKDGWWWWLEEEGDSRLALEDCDLIWVEETPEVSWQAGGGASVQLWEPTVDVSEGLNWSLYTSHLVKEALIFPKGPEVQRPHPKPLAHFCRCTIESILTRCFTSFFPRAVDALLNPGHSLTPSKLLPYCQNTIALNVFSTVSIHYGLLIEHIFYIDIFICGAAMILQGKSPLSL